MDAGIADDVSQLSEGMGMTALEGVTEYMKVTEPRLVLSLSHLVAPGTFVLASYGRHYHVLKVSPALNADREV
jgi:hypothetical protein